MQGTSLAFWEIEWKNINKIDGTMVPLVTFVKKLKKLSFFGLVFLLSWGSINFTKAKFDPVLKLIRHWKCSKISNGKVDFPEKIFPEFEMVIKGLQKEDFW